MGLGIDVLDLDLKTGCKDLPSIPVKKIMHLFRSFLKEYSVIVNINWKLQERAHIAIFSIHF